MYNNVWEMYGINISIEYFKMMPPSDLNLMYSKVVEHEELNLSAIDPFQIHWKGFDQN